jgi:mannose-6-phosphate isomerase-like protein (cupin superfamily)
MKIKKHNLVAAFEGIREYWSPVIVSELNGQAVKIAKVKGDFIWHSHENEDEYFQVLKGQLSIELEDQTLVLDEGDCTTIPKGVSHRPFAEKETWILMFEPTATINTGEAKNELTKTNLARL